MFLTVQLLCGRVSFLNKLQNPEGRMEKEKKGLCGHGNGMTEWSKTDKI